MKKISNYFGARFLFALLALIVAAPGLRAQTANRRVESRLLLVFDTSSSMKKRLPTEEKSVNQLFAITLNGKFHAGDSIGVWTFDKDLRTGEYPLQYWEPQDIITIPIEIIDFLKNRHYSGTTSFDELIPMLSHVMANSPRLTVLIFCDGDGEFKGTGYDNSINTVFRENKASMKKKRQPFVIVLRSQLGKLVGSTINTPDAINVPEFPPLPPPPAAPVTAAPKPAPAPPALPPLVIIGTTVGTNVPPPNSMPMPQQRAPAPIPAPASPPAKAVPQSSIAPPPVAAPRPVEVVNMPSSEPETNTAPVASISTPQAPDHPLVPPTAMTQPPESALSRRGIFLSAGLALLVVAGTVVFLVLRRSSRRSSPSLITESLKKR